jgi:hypothetical protein
MRLGSYDVHPGLLVTVVMVLCALVFFAVLRSRSTRTGNQLKLVAEAEGWTWVGVAPEALRDALDSLATHYAWVPSQVMTAEVARRPIYLFHFESKKGFEETSSTYRGIAVLAPGRTGPNAPTYSIGQWPPGSLRALVPLKADVREEIGGPAFRERYYVEAGSRAGSAAPKGSAVDEVEIPPALEREMLTWDGPTALGLPDGWSHVVIRDQLVMMVWNSRGDISAPAWRNLLTKSQKIGHILGKR